MEKNVVQALEWYARAAEGGNATALYRQGEIYLMGANGVERDEDRGRFYIQSAAEAGVADAWTILGEAMENQAKAADAAPERKKLFEEAREHFRKGAEAGSLKGQRSLGLMLSNGIGGPRDEVNAQLSKRPRFLARAPVNAPFSCPKSSLSRRESGMAPQLTGMNGPSRRGEPRWMALAITSFPTPVSPVNRTGLSVGATWRTFRMASRRPKSAPTISSPELRISSRCK